MSLYYLARFGEERFSGAETGVTGLGSCTLARLPAGRSGDNTNAPIALYLPTRPVSDPYLFRRVLPVCCRYGCTIHYYLS